MICFFRYAENNGGFYKFISCDFEYEESQWLSIAFRRTTSGAQLSGEQAESRFEDEEVQWTSIAFRRTTSRATLSGEQAKSSELPIVEVEKQINPGVSDIGESGIWNSTIEDDSRVVLHIHKVCSILR